MSEPTSIKNLRDLVSPTTLGTFHVEPAAVLSAYDTMKQRAEAAEAKLRDVAYWHEAWKEAEAERDALRKDAAAIAALREPISEGVDKGWSLLQTRCFESDPGMLDSVKYDDFQDALNAAIKAALAVQPTTGEAK